MDIEEGGSGGGGIKVERERGTWGGGSGGGIEGRGNKFVVVMMGVDE